MSNLRTNGVNTSVTGLESDPTLTKNSLEQEITTIRTSGEKLVPSWEHLSPCQRNTIYYRKLEERSTNFYKNKLPHDVGYNSVLSRERRFHGRKELHVDNIEVLNHRFSGFPYDYEMAMTTKSPHQDGTLSLNLVLNGTPCGTRQ